MKIGMHWYGFNDKKVIVNNFYIVEMYFILWIVLTVTFAIQIH